MLIAVLLSCASAPEPGLSVPEITRHVRSDVTDRTGWAVDVRAAIVAAGEVSDADHVCQVLAVVEQESGYEVDPAVPGLGRIAVAHVEDELAALGPLAEPVRRELLGGFEERLAAVRTEQELDRLFRDVVDHHEQRAPGWLSTSVRVALPNLEERLNPIDTAGSMQVSVAFAQALDEDLDPDAVRDLLYTRRGGLRYGTARLFVDEAGYDRPLYRFADYNAGPYASRNAAFQDLVGDLTGAELAPDGDLLRWKQNGRPGEDGETVRALLAWRATYAPDLSERRLRADLRREKALAFEETETWRRVRADWQAANGKEPPYARVPEITLSSPKLNGEWTTARFAERVERRHRDCLAR